MERQESPAQADDAALREWILLASTPGVGARRFLALLERYGTPAAVRAKGPNDPDLSGALRRQLTTPDLAEVAKVEEWLVQPECHLLTLHDPRYPPQLYAISDPPPLLFVCGDPAALHAPQLALVGSRNPSAGGRQCAREFARHLAALGLTITSGLALGIDAAGHRGALAGGSQGATIAVLGTGLDRIYPAAHRELAHEIVANGGALVAELLPGTPPRAGNFPRRNRIISGLSLGTLVVEAALRSGSLITARLAAEQGREVFAIPGSIHNPLTKGCHQLLRQGAKLVEEAGDILEELAPLLQPYLQARPAASTGGEERGDWPPADLDEAQLALLGHLGYDPVSVDELVERSGLTAEAVSSMLLMLELRGVISAAAGGYTRLRQSSS